MSDTKVPKVDLLDIEREPTDQELEAIMRDMVESATTKWESTWSKYQRDLFEEIREAAKIGTHTAETLRSQHGARPPSRTVRER